MHLGSREQHKAQAQLAPVGGPPGGRDEDHLVPPQLQEPAKVRVCHLLENVCLHTATVGFKIYDLGFRSGLQQGSAKSQIMQLHTCAGGVSGVTLSWRSALQLPPDNYSHVRLECADS